MAIRLVERTRSAVVIMSEDHFITKYQHLASLLETRPEGIVFCDEDCRVLFCNSAYSRMMAEVFQLTVEEGLFYRDLYFADQREVWEVLLRRLSLGESFVVEYLYSVRGKTKRYFERSFSPRLEQGRFAGFSEIITDISERKKHAMDLLEAYERLRRDLEERASSYREYNAILAQEIVERQQAEEELQESKERLTQIVQGSTIPTFVIDENHLLTHWNKACEGLTGYKSDEMVGSQNQWKAFYLEKRPTMADLVVDNASEAEIYKFYDNRYRRSSLLAGAYEVVDYFDFGEKEKWLFFTAAPLKNRKGQIIGAIETLQDITAQKRMEKEIRQINDELEQRVEERTMQLKLTYDQLLHAEKLGAVGKLAASIAHEFGNPIIGIRNFLKGLKKRVTLDQSDSEMLDLAIHECVRIKDLIHSLQDFNRPTSGKIATLDVHKTIDDLLLFSKKKLKDRKIQVVKKFTAENPQIQGVADQIKQVILNCLNNAEESITRRGGTITIKTELDRDEFLVHISDTGKGIREEEIAYIFDPFYSTKPAVEGTGLGLSVSYGIIKRHGGNISVKSRPGKGSTFTIRLPVDGMLPGEEMPPFFN